MVMEPKGRSESPSHTSTVRLLVDKYSTKLRASAVMVVVVVVIVVLSAMRLGKVGR